MTLFNTFYQNSVETPAVESAYFPQNGGVNSIVLENTLDMLAVEESLHTMDIVNTAFTHGHVSESAVVESANRGVFQRVKEFLQKVWKRIKSFFAGIVKRFDALTKSGDELLKKYEKELNAKNFSDLKMDLIKFKIEKIEDPTQFFDLENETKEEKLIIMAEEVAKDSEYFEGIKEGINAHVLGLTGKLDAEEFADKIRGVGYDGDDAEDALEKDASPSLSDVRVNFSELKKFTKDYDSAQKKTDKTFSSAIREIQKLEKKYSKEALNSDKDSEDTDRAAKLVRGLTIYTKNVSHTQSQLTVFINAHQKALKARTDQDTRIIRRMITYKGK